MISLKDKVNKIKGSKDKILGSKNKVHDKIDSKVNAVSGIVKDIKNINYMGLPLEIVTAILESFKYSMNDVTIIPGKHLEEPLKFSAFIMLTTLICKAFDLPELIYWKGSILGTVLLSIIVYLSIRKESK